jgi:elongation of very long chain fatty acids protein 6
MSSAASAADSIMQRYFGLDKLIDAVYLKPINTTEASNFSSLAPYSLIFGFETTFQSREYVDSLRLWMAKNWTNSIYYSIIYMLFIWLGSLWMSKRSTKFELRRPLIIWNVCLASFSILGAVRVLPEFVDTLYNKGVVYSVCDVSYAYGITGFWTYMFVMSKLPELVDTVFIVLRRQKLIFLHWYHHATVLIYCWYSYHDHTASGRWFMNMNYFVHSLMYTYYAFRAMGTRMPKIVSKFVTTSQIVQMLIGCYVNYMAWRTKKYEPAVSCHISDENITYSSIMYLSYFLLFFKFFLDAYIFTSSKKSSVTESSPNGKKNN